LASITARLTKGKPCRRRPAYFGWVIAT